jgi:hypothetical protein
MSKYYGQITSSTKLSHTIGENANISDEFRNLSSIIISNCSFSQSLIQQAIYTSHGAELIGAKKSLKDFPNPKARIDFLCSFPYNDPDPVVSKVFNFARDIFKEVYELRNALAHEVWSSSDEYPNAVLLSTLDENSRLLMSQGKLWHKDTTTPEEIYHASVRFIRKIKVVSCDHLNEAIKDINLCNWSLMQINTVLNQEETSKKEESRQPFFVFKGTSHLFADLPASSDPVNFSSSKAKTIN